MTQIPLFQPPSEWTPPETVPNLSEAKEIAVDLETYDPDIKTNGPGWAIDNGYIAGVAIAVEGWKGYFPIRHEGGGNFDEAIFAKLLKKAFLPKISLASIFFPTFKVFNKASTAS